MGLHLNGFVLLSTVGVLKSSTPYPYATTHTTTLIGVPMTHGQPYTGTDHGPRLLREFGLLQQLASLGWRVDDAGDLDMETAAASGASNTASYDGNAKNATTVASGTEKLAETVQQTLQKGNFPLILGGDHSIGIGSLAAILSHQPDVGVIWVDAHADIHTPYTSESGNMHGMPIGMVLAENKDVSNKVPGFSWLDQFPNRLHPSQLVYVGLRDVDAAERQLLRDHGITAYTMTDVDRYGIGAVMDKAIHQDLKGRPLHVSYDIDAVDPVWAPATGTAVRGGLTFREAHYVAEVIASSGRLLAAELVELNPSLSSDAEGGNITIDLGLQILTSLMGKCIL